MRRWAFGIALLGIFMLLLMLYYLPAREISAEGINDTIVNEKVILRGVVESERIVGDLRIWKINGIEVVCSECLGNYKGKEVQILGKVVDYQGKQVGVLRMRVVEK